MEIVEVTSEEYQSGIPNPYYVFASAAFNELNAEKCEQVHYLLCKDKKVRLGIIGGVKEGSFYAPFSAPFGGFVYSKNDIKIQLIDEAITLLLQWLEDQGLRSIQMTLPPSIYHESFIAKLTNSLYRNKFTIEKTDLNYAFNLKNFDDHYSTNLWRNARKNLGIALSNDLVFKHGKTIEEKELAYGIIVKNREERGFPLRMTWQQIKETLVVIKADFFLIYNDVQEKIASAMVFHINPKIVQVVYWGDLPDYSHLKTMNFLSYKIFEFYKKTPFEIVDIGPSTENSIPNVGLCEFKESIGCDISTKLTFSKQI